MQVKEKFTLNLCIDSNENVFFLILGILDAKSCYFLKKTFTSDWDFNRLQDGLNQISSSTPYRSSVYCSYDEVCCGRSCCPDPSVTPKYYYYDTYNYQYDSSDDDSKMYVYL